MTNVDDFLQFSWPNILNFRFQNHQEFLFKTFKSYDVFSGNFFTSLSLKQTNLAILF